MTPHAMTLIQFLNPEVHLDLVDLDEGTAATVQFRSSTVGYEPGVPEHDVDVEVFIDDPTELRHLADRLEGLADSLDDRLQANAQERNGVPL